jgi:hypothetical protein
MKVRQFQMPIPVHIEWCASADEEGCAWCGDAHILDIGSERAIDCPQCAASAMSASGQDPKGLEAKPASPAPKGDAQ